MPASWLYHTNQITNIQVKNLEYFNEKIVFHCLYEPKKSLCPCCGHHENSLKGCKVRKLRMAPLGNKAAFLSLQIYRLKCCLCNQIWWPSPPFVQGKKRFTRSFEQYVVKLMNFGTIEQVSKYLGVSWGLVKDVHKTHLQNEYKSVDFSLLKYIGVDEFSIRKGHEYMTIFINLETAEIIHAVEGKSIDSVRPFLIELSKKAHHIKAIAMDMNAAYETAVRKFLPNVDVVFDRFHVVGLLNAAIEEIRRSQQNKCNDVGLKVLKGCRFLLLSNYEKLNPVKQSSLESLFEINRPLFTVHSMKEQIRLFWTKFTVQEGCKFLGWWIIDALESGIDELWRVGKTLLRRWEGLTNYFKHKITNGKTEGINNKIKTMKRQAYGFRDMDYFKLRLYNLHKVRYSLSR